MATKLTSASWVELGKSFQCIVDWLADGSGDASCALPSTTGLLLYTVETITGTEGTEEAYDLTITDSAGTDVLQGAGLGRSATVKEIISGSPIYVSSGVLTVVVAGAVASGTGKAIVTFLMNK